ncbi:MAG: hypothetical protein JST49_04810 [Bacteroidetes bacterium]|nr:hypothetical protein [Bacteroidota bacterium]
MTTKTMITLGLGFLLALACGNLSAQTSSTGSSSSSTEAQAIVNSAVTNPDVMVVTGRIIDASTKKPIANAKLSFEKFGAEVLKAQIDDKGNYALALNKKEMALPIRVVFKVAGYKRYVAKAIDKESTYVDIDVFMQPLESEEKSEAEVTYQMNDSPFNPLVIKMQ